MQAGDRARRFRRREGHVPPAASVRTSPPIRGTALHRRDHTVYSFLMSNATINYRSLAVSERLELVADIWDSIAEETNTVALDVSAEERHEFRRRLAAHEADPASSLPWETVREELFKDRA